MASGINILAGLWLVLAPFALGFSGVEAAMWNSVVVGAAVAILAMVRVAKPLEFEGLSWLNFVLGLWLIASPFVLGFADLVGVMWNFVILGAIIFAMAAWSAMATRREPTAIVRHDAGPKSFRREESRREAGSTRVDRRDVAQTDVERRPPEDPDIERRDL